MQGNVGSRETFAKKAEEKGDFARKDFTLKFYYSYRFHSQESIPPIELLR